MEAFIAAELERTASSSAATRYRYLQQLFGWLDEEGEIDGSPMAKMRPPKIPEKAVPVLPDEKGPRSGFPICTRTSYGTRSHTTGERMADLRAT